MFSRLKAHILSHPISVLCAVGAIVFGIHLTTVIDYPAGWFDDIEILELGRFSIFAPFPDWSVNLFPAADGNLHPPAPVFHYLAGFIQESLYRLTGSFIPSRIFFLFSLPVAALSLFVWLRTKAIPVSAALPTSLFFLLDPNATICARWYRPDLWTTSIAFATMTLLAVTRDSSAKNRTAACLTAGILTSTMLFLWITSMLLLPLIGLEALQSCRNVTKKTFLRDAMLFVFGAILATAILLMPLYSHIPNIIEQYTQRSELGSGSYDALAKRVLDFFKIAIRSPFVWSAALAGILLGRKFLLHILLFFGLCALMFSTRVYHLRMVQLMPFLFLFTAIALARIQQWGGCLLRHARSAFIGFGLLCHFGLSVVALNYAAIPGANTFAAITAELRAAIPTQSPKVYLYDMEHELYYPGRALGWKMYSYAPRNLIFNTEASAGLLDQIDAIVISKTANPQPTDAEIETMIAHGFKQTDEIRFPRIPVNTVKSALEGLFYAHGYPSCDVYVKTGAENR